MLRKIVAGLRRQDWTAVAIELIVVVAGVFIGVQASNWNQQRADRQLGRDYVQRLIHDLAADRTAIESESAYYSEVLKSVLKTDELLRSSNPDPRELIVSAYRASEIVYVAPVRSTWDQIVSSGHLGLLPDAAIQLNLPQYYAFDVGRDAYNQGLASAYRRSVRSIIPLDMQAAIRESCSDVRDKYARISGFAKDCRFDVEPGTLVQVADALRYNADVAANLRYQYSFAISATLNFQGVAASLSDALAGLGATTQVARETAP